MLSAVGQHPPPPLPPPLRVQPSALRPAATIRCTIRLIRSLRAAPGPQCAQSGASPKAGAQCGAGGLHGELFTIKLELQRGRSGETSASWGAQSCQLGGGRLVDQRRLSMLPYLGGYTVGVTAIRTIEPSQAVIE